MSPALESGFLTTRPPGQSSLVGIFDCGQSFRFKMDERNDWAVWWKGYACVPVCLQGKRTTSGITELAFKSPPMGRVISHFHLSIVTRIWVLLVSGSTLISLHPQPLRMGTWDKCALGQWWVSKWMKCIWNTRHTCQQVTQDVGSFKSGLCISLLILGNNQSPITGKPWSALGHRDHWWRLIDEQSE